MSKREGFIKALKETGLYVITDASIAKIPHYEIVKKSISGGARIIQIRDKTISDSELLRIAKKVIEDFPAIYLIINDRVDVAILSSACGVHLGQDDIPPEYVRQSLGDNFIIGISTHNIEQIQQAINNDTDYIAIGPIFSTKTKISNNKPLGTDYASKIRSLTNKCIVAIGGITLQTAQQLWQIGIDAVAVVSDIMKADDISNRVSDYIYIYKKIISTKGL